MKVNSTMVNKTLSFIHYPKLMFSIRRALGGMRLEHFKHKNKDQDKINQDDESLEVHISPCCVSLYLSVYKKVDYACMPYYSTGINDCQHLHKLHCQMHFTASD